MQRALASADPSLPFSGFYSMSDLRAQTLSTQCIEVALLSVMAALALLLSAVGIFALVANMVVERTREIGIRIALGSTVRRAMVQVGGPGVRASAIGLVAGLLLCAAALRAMRAVLAHHRRRSRHPGRRHAAGHDRAHAAHRPHQPGNHAAG
jgi:hypothetical protein